MGWQDDLIKRWERQIADFQESIDWLESGKMELGEVSAGGQVDKELTISSLEYYKRTKGDLEALVAKVKAEKKA